LIIKHLPLNLKFYRPQAEFLLGKDDPDFRSKIDFALELVDDALKKNIPFSYVVMDSWYPSTDFIEFIAERKRKFIA
jgi:SRSO17 transposase